MDKGRRTQVREGFVFAFLLGMIAGVVVILLLGGKIVLGNLTLYWDKAKKEAHSVAESYEKSYEKAKEQLKEKLRR